MSSSKFEDDFLIASYKKQQNGRELGVKKLLTKYLPELEG